MTAAHSTGMIGVVIGTTVGSYRIISKLSVGGMGTVYRAEHVLIGKLAAVKVLREELCRNAEVVSRFLNEARAATSIKHPGIVEVFDFGHMPSGEAFLTMEYLDGMSLARRLKTRGRLGEGEAAMLLRGVCSALQAAHAKGIVHRDLKPDNLFLVIDPDSATGERTKILDFGIAKLTDVGLAGATKTGAVMGTPTYMSPEQCRGTGEVDHRADLYSLGCILHELITGRPPFVNLGAGELIGAHLYLDPAPVSKYLPEVTAETAELIMSLLSKQPADRPQTARELGQRLARIAQTQGWITQTAPSGVTAPSLPRSPEALPTEIDAVAGDGETLPSKPPGATTPQSSSAPALFVETAANPTTLSGAASSILDVPRRSRKGLGLAMAAAALIAGGTVALLELRGGDAHRPVTPVQAAQPAITPTRETPTPVEIPKPAIAPAPVPEPEPVQPSIAATPPTAVAKKPAKLPVKAAVKPKQPAPPVEPVTPKKPSLIETDI